MKKPLILLPLALLGAGAYWFWHSRQPSETGELTAYGNVDVRNVNLAFRVSGRLEEVLVEEGDAVAPGQALARLDREPLEIALEAARAQQARAEANLAKLRAGFRPEEFEQARAALAQAEAAADRATREQARQRELEGTGASTPQALDAAEAAAAEATARVRQARAQLALLEAGYRSEDIAQAEAELAGARARVADAERQVADTELVAPSPGVVQTRIVEPGSIIGAGQNVLHLALTEKTWARAYLPEPQLGRIHPGQAALVYTDSRPETPYHGQVGFISPTAEFTPRNIETTELRSALIFRFHVVIDDPDEGLRQGMPVTVHLAE